MRSTLEDIDESYKTIFFVYFFKTLASSFLIVCFHRDGTQLFTLWTWHLRCLLPQQSFLFGCITNLFLFWWKTVSKVCSGSIFPFCIFPQVQPSVQISNAEMLIRASPPPQLTLLAFSEVSYKWCIKYSDHLCHLDPGLRRNLGMMTLRFAPLKIWDSGAPKTVS